VGVGGLPLIAELGNSPVLAVRHEDRIEPEAARAAGLMDDPAFEDAGPAQLPAVRRDRDELADVARSPGFPLEPAELGEQPFDGLAGGEPRRLDPGPAVEPGDLEARVLAEDPVGLVERTSVLGLGAGVLVVGRARLRRILVSLERLDLPAGQGGAELAELPGVLGREPRG
jgi:hypothetical protein